MADPGRLEVCVDTCHIFAAGYRLGTESEYNETIGELDRVVGLGRVRVWHLAIKPGERLPVHRHVLDYFWTALTPGKGRSHYHDGRTVEAEYRPGDTQHHRFGPGEFMMHDLENIGDTTLAFTTVEFLDSANRPLPIPEQVRLSAA